MLSLEVKNSGFEGFLAFCQHFPCKTAILGDFSAEGKQF
jgi:hypothetical protein